MKRTAWMWIPLLVALLVPATGCKKKGDRALSVLPSGAKVVFSLDFARFAKLDVFDQIVKKPAGGSSDAAMPFKDYADFVAKTGIDPKKDVSAIAGAVYGELQDKNPDVLVAVLLKYDRAKLLALLHQTAPGLKEETVGAAVLLSLPESSGRPIGVALVGNDMMLAGSATLVRQAIDLAAGKGSNLLGDSSFKKPLAKVNRGSMFWMALGTLPDTLKRGPQGGSPIPLDLSKAEALLLAMDYDNKVLSADLQLLLPDAAVNEQIASTLNGFKGLGAAAAAQDPDAGQLLNSLKITSSADGVQVTFALPETLLKKLADKAKEKAMPAAPVAEPTLDEQPAADQPAAEPVGEETPTEEPTEPGNG